jgi:hypothetical protein
MVVSNDGRLSVFGIDLELGGEGRSCASTCELPCRQVLPRLTVTTSLSEGDGRLNQQTEWLSGQYARYTSMECRSL